MKRKLILAMLAAAALTAFSQRQDDQRIRVAVDAVNLLVSINSKNGGEFITDLGKEDFTIFEDGTRQRISNFSKQTDLPLTIALCIDTSSSVKLKLGFEKEAALDFLYEVVQPTDRALLAEFDTGVTLLHDYTSNPNDLAREIRKLKAGGGTSLYDAIYLVAEQKMLDEPGRRTIVIMSDGSDLTSTHRYEDALRMVLRAEAAIYAISTTRIGASIDHEGDNALKQLTEATGGRVFFPFANSRLAEAFRAINEELRSQYSITYTPTNRRKDGTFRKVKVDVDRGGIVVRHRQGYYADLAGEVAGPN